LLYDPSQAQLPCGRMQPRRTFLELFSTFIGFENDRFQQWLTEPALRRNLQRQASNGDAGEANPSNQDFWVFYWHQVWTSEQQKASKKFAVGHLTAYLQEACYWVAHRTARQAKGVQYGVADCFQVAIATVPTLLKGYSPDQGASLATYARLCFSNTIRDTLRQQREVTSRSDWGLLRKASQKQVKEALQTAGLSPEQTDAYRLAWMAYKTCWAGQTAATRQLAAPDQETWEAIADTYNRQIASETGTNAEQVTAATIEQWLKDTAKALRRLLHPNVVSLNVPKFEDGGEWQDDLPDGDATPWVELIQTEEIQERQQQRAQVNERLRQALTELKPQDRELLFLYYSQGSTQQQIADQLQIKQYSVSRRLSRVKETLLLNLAIWSQEALHSSPTSPALNQMSLVLEEWLQQHFKENAIEDRLLRA
jgi:RNA polymerase sigma factor (sigma-70 family)